MNTQVVVGKDREILSRDLLNQKVQAFDSVLIDIGAGDGKGSLRYARKHPRTLVIAIDSSFDALEKTSLATKKKPSRGGVENLLCLYGNIKKSVQDLSGLAGLTRVILPWGDLLEGIACMDEETLKAIADCTKLGSHIEIVVNGEIWKSNLPKHLEHLGEVTPDFFISNQDVFKNSGITILESYEMLKDEIIKLDTTWTSKLMSSRIVASFIMAKAVRT